MKLDPGDHEAIEEIVEKTIVQTFAKFGIDISTPEKVIQFQDDLRYVREWRTSMTEVRRAGLMAAAGTIVTGVIAVIVLGLRQWFFRGNGG